MAKPASLRMLDIWMNGEHVAVWHFPTNAPQSLTYDPDWVNRAQGRPLSLSLPFQPGNRPLSGAAVENYFENLLPDSESIRRRIQTR